jgi:hypothetical protein
MASIGRLNENVTPLPLALFSDEILPQWDAIMFFDINNLLFCGTCAKNLTARS